MHVHLPLTGRYVGSCFKQGAVMAWGFTANTFLKSYLPKLSQITPCSLSESWSGHSSQLHPHTKHHFTDSYTLAFKVCRLTCHVLSHDRAAADRGMPQPCSRVAQGRDNIKYPRHNGCLISDCR